MVEFKTFCLLNTYSQNNGMNEAAFAKRRQWDHEVESFLTASPPARPSKPIVWTGDLNCCHREVDTSHPDFFLSQKPEGKKDREGPPPAPGDTGQPGYTLNERLRFDATLKAARLTDASRHLHGDRRFFTWYGHPGVSVVGKYKGKGMRLDYFLVPPEILPRVSACDAACDGIPESHIVNRPTSVFLGSDHIPVLLRLDAAAAAAGAPVAAAGAPVAAEGGPVAAVEGAPKTGDD